MQLQSFVPGIIALCLLVSIVFLAGCSSPDLPSGTGSVQVLSSPPGAEIYLDHEYRGTTPGNLTGILAGNHTLELRKDRYEPWTASFTVTHGSAGTIPVTLVSIPVTLPVTFTTTRQPAAAADLPQIHIDGYWTYPPAAGTGNPVPLLVHVDGFNVGKADAREVTVSGNLYYQGRQICWNTIYLGTLKAGGHVVKDTMVSCTLPSGLNTPDLTIRFENAVVNP
jgi:hypothetical protein